MSHQENSISVHLSMQKPDQAKKLKNRNIERAKQLGIEYMKSKGVNLEKK